MTATPSYEELEYKVKQLENEIVAHHQAEEALRKSLELHRTVVENIDVVLTVIGVDFKIQWVSPAVSKWFFSATASSKLRLKETNRPSERRSQVPQNTQRPRSIILRSASMASWGQADAHWVAISDGASACT